MPRTAKYCPPEKFVTEEIRDMLPQFRTLPHAQQERLALGNENSDTFIYHAGDLSILDQPCVAIIGTRKPSDAGVARAAQIARDMANNGITVMSGLALGVDTAALTSAINNSGKVAAVIGTPLEKAYPAANKRLQEQIYKEHLLISPFEQGMAVFKSHFPHRNKIMAALSDASIIVEAGETSGTIHQAAECSRLGRHLFFMKSLVDLEHKWVTSFLDTYEKAHVLTSSQDVLDILALITDNSQVA